MRLQHVRHRDRLGLVVIVVVVFGLLVGSPAWGDTITLQYGVKYDDVNSYTGMTNNMIRTQDPEMVHSNPSSLTIGTNGAGMPQPLNRVFLDFDLSPLLTLSGGTPVEIQSVELNLWITKTSSGSLRIEPVDPQTVTAVSLHAYEFALDNSTATWDEPASGDVAGGTPGDELGQLSSLMSTSDVKQTFTSVALAEWVQAAVDGDGNARFMLKQPTENLGEVNRIFFRSVIHDTAAERPQLVINYNLVPEPNGLILMGFGVVSLLAFAKRKR